MSSPLLPPPFFLSFAAFLGSVLGYTLGLVNQNLEKQAASMPNKPATMQGGSFSGPPKVLALNLAVFSAVQSGLTLAVKKYRGVEGNDDGDSAAATRLGMSSYKANPYDFLGTGRNSDSARPTSASSSQPRLNSFTHS